MIAVDLNKDGLELFEYCLHHQIQTLPEKPQNSTQLKSSDFLTKVLWSFSNLMRSLAVDGAKDAQTRLNRLNFISKRKRKKQPNLTIVTQDAMSYSPPKDCVIYAEPPYAQTESYKTYYTKSQKPNALPITELAEHLRALDRPWILSEQQSFENLGLCVVDYIDASHTFTMYNHAKKRREYLLTDQKWVNFFNVSFDALWRSS